MATINIRLRATDRPVQTAEDGLRYLADGLLERVREIVDLTHPAYRDAVPAFFTCDDPAFVDAYTNAYQSLLQAVLLSLRRGRALPVGPIPAAAEEARLAAEFGLPLDVTLQTYRVFHRVVWELLVETAEEHLQDVNVRSDTLRLVSRFLFEFVDKAIPLATAAYDQGRADRTRDRDRDRRRRELVRDLLHALPIDESQLAYDVRGSHVGVIAWGMEPAQACTGLAVWTKRTLLSVVDPSNAVWAWLGDPGVDDDPSARIRGFEPPEGTFLAVGSRADGLDGFRRTHAHAQRAYKVASIRPRPVTSYEDVSLAFIAMSDPTVAREFVGDELGALANGTDRSRLLRETLQAYFTTGHNAAATGAMLSVHERTVAYRLRSIEACIGRTIISRRDELAMALVLHPFVLDDGATPIDGAGPHESLRGM